MRPCLRSFVLVLGPLLAGCMGDDTNPPVPPPSDAGADHTVAADASDGAAEASARDGAPVDGSSLDGAALDGNAPDAPASVLDAAVARFANWSSDSPSVDFCLTREAGAPIGPLLGSSPLADAGPAALTFPTVSRYFELPPGTYSARVVAAGVSDCAAGVGPDSPLPALGAGTFATVAIAGEAHPVAGHAALAVHSFLDDDRAGAGVALRFIHAAPSLSAVDVGADDANGAFGAWFSGVTFAAAGAARNGGVPDGGLKIDARGYAAVAPLSDVTLRVRAAGAKSDVAVATHVSVAAGAVVTLTLLDGTGVLGDGGPPPAQLMECVDNAGRVDLLGACTLIAPAAAPAGP